MPRIYITTPVEQRFWSKVNKAGPVPEVRPDLGPCWIWTAGIDKDGYGEFKVRRNRRAHRRAYEALVGPIPEGLEIDHLCRVRRCVRPEHLEAVTSKMNNERGLSNSAINARKTHCVNGHPFEGENLHIQRLAGRLDYRRCRACLRAAKARCVAARGPDFPAELARLARERRARERESRSALAVARGGRG